MRKLYFLIFLTLSLNSNGQNITTEQFNDLKRTDIELTTDIDKYPYLAVSVLFRGEEKLGTKEFAKKIFKMKYFFTEVSVTNQGKTTSAPLYFLKREKGRFSTDVFKDRTVVRKVPLSIYSNNMPTIGIDTEIKFQNQAVTIIKAINEKVGPLINNPTEIFGPGATQLFYGFLDDVVNQLSDEKKVKAGVNFDAFAPDKLGILPSEYKVVILKPQNVDIENNGFKIGIYQNELQLLKSDGSKYDDYPYLIIEIGLSNYLEIDNIPSNYYKTHKLCSISGKDLILIENTLKNNRTKLTTSQYSAEELLLSYYKTLKITIDGVKEQGKLDVNKDLLVNAYDAYYNFKVHMNFKSIETELLNSQYVAAFTHIESCVENNIKLLKYAPLVDLTLPIFSIKDFSKVSNDKLGDLYYFLNETEKVEYLIGSQFYGAISARIGLTENTMYNNHFRISIDKILRQNSFNSSVTDNYAIIEKNSSDYSNCKKCLLERKKATDKYTLLKGNNTKLRNKIRDNIDKSEQLEFKNRQLLNLVKVNIDLLQGQIDTTNNQTLIDKKLKFEDIQLRLKQKDNSILELKNFFNEMFANSSYSSTQKNLIDNNIVRLNNINIEISKIKQDEILPLLDSKEKVLVKELEE